jgi:GTP-dependent dephospho-CoA kinase
MSNLDKTLYITKELCDKMKNPFGTLIQGEYKSELLSMIEQDRPEKLIVVGDFTSKKVQEYGITPNMIVVDNKTERNAMDPVPYPAERTYNIKNPAGTLSPEAVRTISEAMKNSDYARVNVVEGEEDLLALIAVKDAPLGSYVLYGQPKEGVVIVKVTEDKKKDVRQMLGEMRTE